MAENPGLVYMNRKRETPSNCSKRQPSNQTIKTTWVLCCDLITVTYYKVQLIPLSPGYNLKRDPLALTHYGQLAEIG